MTYHPFITELGQEARHCLLKINISEVVEIPQLFADLQKNVHNRSGGSEDDLERWPFWKLNKNTKKFERNLNENTKKLEINSWHVTSCQMMIEKLFRGDNCERVM